MTRAVTNLEQELDRLFGLPLDQFTSARNELVRRLKAKGDAEAAAAARAVAKPTIASWTINQLSRSEAAAVRPLLDAGDRLRQAQQHLLREGGSAESVWVALGGVREAVKTLTRQAQALLEKSGRPATAAVLERIGRTLQAAAVQDDGRGALEAGRLTTDLEPPGFETLVGVSVSTAPRTRRARDELAERRRRSEDDKRRKRELQQRVRELERTARAAGQEAKRAERVAAEARRVAERARADAEKAVAELASA